MQRPFASGSRQAPDPFDHYLEKRGFYRKHTARDSSCLFRVISEQMYDTQLHHLAVRQNLVNYMRKYKEIFQLEVDKDIDDYLDELSKPKTFGTMVELRAFAYIYRRNIILFEAYNTGRYMVEEESFNDSFRVFFTPEKHFDSVFKNDFIEIAAFCQSICFEILYKDVFKLPDVTYAVELMLHGSCSYGFTTIEYDGPYEKEIAFKDGRVFKMDLPIKTDCILENYLLCHFHNPDFMQFADNFHQEMQIDTIKSVNHKTCNTDSMLPDKYISCVRQLLKEGITPFPYKVAKALDPDIYRNIEFDAWSTPRKDRFKNWYTGGNGFQVGVKCLVKLRNSESDLYNCHIQEMSPDNGPCLIFVEELGEKRIVSYDSLQALPPDQAKPWAIPFRFQKHTEKYSPKTIVHTNVRKTGRNKRKHRDTYIIPTYQNEYFSDGEFTSSKEDIAYRYKYLTSIQHFQPSYEFMTMPLTFEPCVNQNPENPNNNQNRNVRRGSINSAVSHNSAGGDAVKDDERKDDESDLEYIPEPYPFNYGYPDSYYSYSYDNSMIHPGAHNMVSNMPSNYCMYSTPPYAQTPGGGLVAHGILMQPSLPYGPLTGSNSNTLQINNFGRLANYDGSININAPRSILPNGSDLPTDIPTLRFFYNLGWDYYKMMQTSGSTDPIPIDNSAKSDAGSKLALEFHSNIKIESENASSTHVKPDQNNNLPANNNQPSNRRFHSRYFNSRKEKNASKRNNNPFLADFGKSNNATKTNSNNYPNSNGGGSNKTTNTIVASTAEQTIHTSSVATSSENNYNTEINPTTQTVVYSASHPPPHTYASCLPIYSTEAEQQQQQQPSGMFLPPPVMTVPYGMYSAPRPPPYSNYLPPMAFSPPFPPPSQNTYFTPTSGESSSLTGYGNETSDNGSYAYMSCPIYYSPSNNNTSSITTTPGGPVTSGYWYSTVPPPQSALAISAASGNQSTNGNNITPGNPPINNISR